MKPLEYLAHEFHDEDVEPGLVALGQIPPVPSLVPLLCGGESAPSQEFSRFLTL